MAEPVGTLEWNMGQLTTSMHLDEDDVRSYFTDGRRVSFIIERRIAKHLKGTLARSEGASWDVFDPDGGKWEVRSITKTVYFCPSKMVGSGRRFKRKGFLQKLNQIEGYIVADITLFPSIPFWILTSATVHSWWKNGKLGKKSKISRENVLKLIGELP